MTWKSFHHRGDVLRAVIATADLRRDGLLPMAVAGVEETFDDELALLGTLQLRWHTRLAGRIERELMDQPMDLERAVVTAWIETAHELPGIRAIVDRHRAHPLDHAMSVAMDKSACKERVLMAVMAGRASAQDDAAVRIGAQLEERARAELEHSRPAGAHRADARLLDTRPRLLDRIKAALAA